jgi:uncharacterized membrane protein
MADADYSRSVRGGTVLDDEKIMPLVVHGLYLLGFVTGGLSAVVGLIIAYAGLREADWRRSHYLHAIYTFWLTLAAFAAVWAAIGLGVLLTVTIIGAIIGLPLIVVGIVATAVPAIWFGVRAVVAAMYAARGEAYPRPRTWLV